MSLVLRKPLVTEKIVKLTEKSGNRDYAFIVDVNANKIQIKKAIEDYYGVEVVSIRTSVMIPRRRRRYTKTGIITGQTSSVKKAFVRLSTPTELDIYQNN